MAEFRMPSLGSDMDAGTLIEWLVKPGDCVKRGDVVAVVDTQKGAIEVEIYQAGQIEKFLVDLDTKVPVGTPLALIRAEGELGATAAPAPPATPVGTAKPAIILPAAPEPAPPPTVVVGVAPAPAVAAAIPAPVRARPLPLPGVLPGGRRASPAARRLAQERGVDLTAVAGSGPDGAILYADVEQRIGEPVAQREKGRAPSLDLNAMRVAIAAAMARSKREIPHYYLSHQIDVTACEEWLARKNAPLPPEGRILLAALALKATALAARRFLAFNGFYRNDKFEPSQAVHVGVAIAIRGGGLAAPALHDTDQLTVDDLMSNMRDLVQRTRTGRIRSSEVSDPTITVSSLGERGVEALHGIIYPPQVAIVGFGKAVLRPWVVDGAIGPRSVTTITLAADHRVTDGHAGAMFLAEIGKLLQEPEKL
jgi:pyruvate dehydrogenase E2 component (dihydrolipoamide acetyltransferase)